MPVAVSTNAFMVYALSMGAVACATAICFCNHPHVSGCVQMLDDIGEGYLSMMLQHGIT